MCTKKNPNQIFNAMCDIKNEKDFKNVNIPKVVTTNKSNLLYMSRAPIPLSKNKKFIRSKKQVCIYSFPRVALKIFSNSSKTKNEFIEDIEILRFLDLGYAVKMIEVSGSSSPGACPISFKTVCKMILKKNIIEGQSKEVDEDVR